MVLVNRTFDSTGPIVSYSANNWFGPLVARLPSDSPNSYHNATTSGSMAFGATATITLNGTAIYLFGTQGPSCGLFSVQIDGVQISSGSRTASSFSFQQIFYSNDRLPFGLHTVIITNQSTDPVANIVDLDYLTWTTRIGDDTSQLSNSFVDLSDNRWIFFPADAQWPINPSLEGYAGSFPTDWRSTGVTGATARLNFTGDSITVYGGVSKDCDAYHVLLDAKLVLITSARKDGVALSAPMFYADNLGPGAHVVSLINTPANDGPFAIALQGALITTAFSAGSPPEGTITVTSSSHTSVAGANPSIPVTSFGETGATSVSPGESGASGTSGTAGNVGSNTTSLSNATPGVPTPGNGLQSDIKGVAKSRVVVGVGVGVAVLIFWLLVAAFLLYRRKKKRRVLLRNDSPIEPFGESTLRLLPEKRLLAPATPTSKSAVGISPHPRPIQTSLLPRGQVVETVPSPSLDVVDEYSAPPAYSASQQDTSRRG